MATRIITNMSEYCYFPASFQHPYLPTTVQHNQLDFQEISEEEEEVEEEEEEEEEMEMACSNYNSATNVRTWTGPASPEPSEPDMTKQLLLFSDLISRDIQKYFGRKNDPDRCSIYDDHPSRAKSGRAMYYDSLMRITKNGDRNAIHSAPMSPVAIDNGVLQSVGGQDVPGTLGPLAELFEVGLRRYTHYMDPEGQDGSRSREDRKYSNIVPMHQRQLPPSFWKEPSPIPPCLFSTNTPDFSDLLANWTSETGLEFQLDSQDFTGELGRHVLDVDHYS